MEPVRLLITRKSCELKDYPYSNDRNCICLLFCVGMNLSLSRQVMKKTAGY